MSLEIALSETNELLRAIHAVLQSGIQAQASLGDPEPAKPGRGRPKKIDTVATPPTQPLTADQASQALFGHVNTPAPAPAPAPVAAPAVAEVEFPTVLEAFMLLSKSTAPGHGREGLMKILNHYLPHDPKPSVPKLAALNKHAEILTVVQTLLGQQTAPAVEEPYDPLA